jgi:PAS domain S-box-containing protein
MFDRDGNPKYVNDAYLRLIGLDRDTFEQAASRGLAWRDTIYEEDIELTTQIWSRMRDSRTPQTFEYRVKVLPKQPGETPGIRTLETISFPEIDENGHIVTVQGWLVDISPRKRLETLMAQRLEDALETRRASENFIDMGKRSQARSVEPLVLTKRSLARNAQPAICYPSTRRWNSWFSRYCSIAESCILAS